VDDAAMIKYLRQQQLRRLMFRKSAEHCLY
jgi:hypothetical protein